MLYNTLLFTRCRWSWSLLPAVSAADAETGYRLELCWLPVFQYLLSPTHLGSIYFLCFHIGKTNNGYVDLKCMKKTPADFELSPSQALFSGGLMIKSRSRLCCVLIYFVADRPPII